MHRIFRGVLVLTLAASLAARAQVVLQPRLLAGTTLRYSFRIAHQLQVDYNRRLGVGQQQDVQRKYEVSGILALTVMPPGEGGSIELEGRFEELRLSQWYWGEDRTDVEQMLAAVARQQVRVTRDAAGTVNLIPAARIPLERFRADIQSLESLATLPLVDAGAEPVAPGARWQREIPPERFRYDGQPAPDTTTETYEYVGDRTLNDRPAALLAIETLLPLGAMEFPGQAQATLQLAQEGMSLRTGGEARTETLALVELARGLLLAAQERTNSFYRVTVRNELVDPQAKIPVPLMTVRFTGERAVRWLGPGEEGLVAAVTALPALDALRGGRHASRPATRVEPSLGDIARELRAQREQSSPETVRRTPTRRPAVEERELQHFPVNRATAPTSDLARFDPTNSRDGNGSLQVIVQEPAVIPLFAVTNLDIENAQVVYQAWLRTEDVRGQAYLEMLCYFEGLGEFFSRGLAQALTGTHSWVRVETPFLLERGQKPSRISLNLVINGRGRVWIDDIRLLRRPLR